MWLSETLREVWNRKRARREKLRALTSFLGVFDALEARHLLSASPLGDELLVNDDFVNGNQITYSGAESVALTADGRFIAVFGGKGPGDSHGVFFRQFDGDGVSTGPTTRLNQTTSGSQDDASITAFENGSFVAVWSGVGSGDSRGVFARMFNSNGTPSGGEFRVNETVPGSQTDAEVAADGFGNFVVTWEGRGEGDTNGIFARRYDATGNPLGGEFRVNTIGQGSQQHASIDMAPGGAFLVGWRDRDGVFMQRFDAGGNAVGSQAQVNSTSNRNLRFPSVAIDDLGNSVVVWNGKGLGDSQGIFRQQFLSDGTPNGGEQRVNATTGRSQAYPSVSMAGDGTSVVTWSSWQQDGSGIGVFAQEFDTTGQPMGNEIQSNTTSQGNQRYSSVSMNNNGDYVIGWSGKGDGDSQGVYARLFVQLPSTDVTPPMVSAALFNDTGESNTDAITNDPTTVGNVTDDQSGVATLFVSVDGGSATAVTLDPSGDFTFDPGLALDGTDDGAHTVVFTATDNESNVATTAVSFTLVTTAPVSPIFDLDPNFDTAPSGDMQTEFDVVTLLGQTRPNTSVTLLETGDTTTSNAIGDFAFAGVPLIIGDNVLMVRATDIAGNQAIFSKTITRTVAGNSPPVFDPVGPLSVMPGDRLEVQLSATDPDGDPITFSISSTGVLPTGMLKADGTLIFEPTPAEIGSYQFTLSASDGIAETTQQVPLDVVTDSVTTTRLSGFVLDTNSAALVDVRVSVGNIQSFTGADGSFQLDFGSNPPLADALFIHANELAGPETYPFIAEKLVLLLEHEVFDNVNNVISRPIFLPALDMANAVTIDPNQDKIVTTAAIPGVALFVAAGTLLDQQGNPFSGDLSITEVPRDITPAALPANLLPELVVTIQPGEMVFTQPAPLTFPNTAGWAAGLPMDLFSINPVTGDFDDVGELIVSPDGLLIETISGGVLNSSWHFATPQPGGGPTPNPVPSKVNRNNSNNSCDSCKDGKGVNSLVETHSGVLLEFHDLVTYQSLGETRGVTLTYDSLRADPRHIVHTGFMNVDVDALTDPIAQDRLRLMAEIDVSRGNFGLQVPGFSGGQFGLDGGENFWTLPIQPGDVDAALQVDLSNQSTGKYDYDISSGIVLRSDFTGTFVGTLDTDSDHILNVNSIDSPFGAGWGLNGLRQIVENPDFSVVLVNGDGGELFFDATEVIGGQDLVIEDGATDSVLRFDGATGNSLGEFVAGGAGGLLTPRNPTFGSDGNLYVISNGVNFGRQPQVLRFDGQTGAFIDVFVDTGEGGFGTPNGGQGLAFDSLGNLYVSAGFSGVLRYDTNGDFVDQFANAANGVSNAGPIEVSPDGKIYVYDRQTRHISRFDPVTGQNLDADMQFVDAGLIGFAAGQDFDFGPAGNIFVVDGNSREIVQFSGADGSAQGTFLDFGTATPASITLGPDSQFYIGVGFGFGNPTVVQRHDGVTGAFVDDFISDSPAAGLPRFTPDSGAGETIFASPPGHFSKLTKLVDGTFRHTTPDQMVSLYDTAGRLVSETDRNGNETRWEYNGDGTLARIIDPVGLETTFAYTAGLLTSTTDPALRVTQFEYDANRNLTKITDPDGTFRKFTYDARHHMTGEIDKRNNSEQTVYDFAGRVDMGIRKDNSAIDVDPTQVRGLYQPGQTIDPLNSPVSQGDLTGQAAVVDGNGNTSIKVLDNQGQVVSESDDVGTLPSVERNEDNLVTKVTDARGNETTVTYDAFGNVTSIEDAISLGTPSQFTYDAVFNQLTRFTDELGRQVLFDVDPANGNMLSMTEVVGAIGGDDDLVTQFTYTAQGLTDTLTDPLGRVTDLDYNALGLLTTMTFAVGTVDQASMQLEYDTAGNVSAVVDENGNRIEFAYDSLNRVTQLTEADPDGIGSLTSPITVMTYDNSGNIRTVTDARNNTTTFEYDPLDRPTKVIDAQTNESQYAYDDADNLTAVIDPLLKQTQLIYDARNRLIGQIDPDNGSTTFGYDLDDNLTSIIDPNSNHTQYSYDARNRVTSETDPFSNVTSFVYDVVNNLTSMTDRNGRVTQFNYDDVNRLTAETWVGDGNVIQFAYDKSSNLLSAIDDFSSLVSTYDNRDRLLTVDNNGTPNAPSVVLTYAYDAASNLLSVSGTIDGSAGGLNSYQYDGLNRVVELTQSGTNVSDKRVEFTYNAVGQFESITRFADLTASQMVVGSTYTYDTLNRLETLTHDNSTSTVAFTNLAYDTASRITQLTNIDGSTTYSYENRDQLTGADHSDAANPDEYYAYDANGNRSTSHFPNNGYITGVNNRLISDGTYTYNHDDEGNLILRTEIATGDFREFEWDHRNRMIAVVDKNSSGTELQRVEFTYDVFNRRIAKLAIDSAGTTLTHFVYDGDDVLLDFVDDDGAAGPNAPTLVQRYLHGPAVDQVLAQDDGAGNVIWHLTDHLGTVTDLVDNSGIVVNHIKYDSYGNVIDQSNSVLGTRYLYTGREFDEETRLYYYRARYYDAAIGRFVSEDPIRFAGSDPNLYRYVQNSPTINTDPTGLKVSLKLDPKTRQYVPIDTKTGKPTKLSPLEKSLLEDIIKELNKKQANIDRLKKEFKECKDEEKRKKKFAELLKAMEELSNYMAKDLARRLAIINQKVVSKSSTGSETSKPRNVWNPDEFTPTLPGF